MWNHALLYASQASHRSAVVSAGPAFMWRLVSVSRNAASGGLQDGIVVILNNKVILDGTRI